MAKNNDKAEKDFKSIYGFDPTGLERAAKALKELDNSPNATKAFEIVLKEEEYKSIQEKNKLK